MHPFFYKNKWCHLTIKLRSTSHLMNSTTIPQRKREVIHDHSQRLNWQKYLLDGASNSWNYTVKWHHPRILQNSQFLDYCKSDDDINFYSFLNYCFVFNFQIICNKMKLFPLTPPVQVKHLKNGFREYSASGICVGASSPKKPGCTHIPPKG